MVDELWFPALSAALAAFFATALRGGCGIVGGVGIGGAGGGGGFLPGMEFGQEVVSFAGVAGGEIACFPGIIREMIEFGGFGFEELDEFPVA